MFFNIYFYKYTFQFIIKHFKENPVLRMLNCLPQLFITKTHTTNTEKAWCLIVLIVTFTNYLMKENTIHHYAGKISN